MRKIPIIMISIVLITVCLLGFALGFFEKAANEAAQYDPINDNNSISSVKIPKINQRNGLKKINLPLIQAQKLKNEYQYSEAIDYYKAALTIEPNNRSIYEELACSYAAEEQYKEIINLYNKLKKKMPENACVLGTLSQAYAANNEFNSSLDALSRAVLLDSDSECITEAKKNIDLIYHTHIYESMRKKDFNKVGIYAKARLALDRTNASGYYYSGIAYYKNGQTNKAIKDFNQAIYFDESYKSKINDFLKTNR